MTLKKNQPIFFKKLPRTEETPPNATVLRCLGNVSGECAVEIETAGQKWIVKESECWTVEDALCMKAAELHEKIEKTKTAFGPAIKTNTDLATAINVSVGTLRRWQKIVKGFLRTPQPPLDPRIKKDVPLPP